MSHVKDGSRFARTALVFFVGTVLSKVVSLFLIPVYTRVLSPAEYGTYDLWFTVCTFLAPILFFQAWDGVYRFAFDAKDLGAIVTNGVVLLGYGFVLYTAAAILALAGTGADSAAAIYVFGASTALQYFAGYLARCELRNGLLVWTGVLNTVLGSGLSVWLLIGQDFGITALFWGLSIGNLAQMTIISARLHAHRHIQWRYLDLAVQRKILRFSLPLCAASAAYWLLSGFTRLSLVWFDGAAANGVYAVADRFAFAMALVSTVVMYAWQEFLYIHDQRDGSTHVRDAALRFIFRGVVLAGACTLVAVSLGFEKFVGRGFESSYELVPLTVGAASFNALANTAGSLFMASRSTTQLLTTSAIAACVNVVLALLLIPRLGAAGGAIGLAVAFAALAAMRVRLAARGLGLNWLDKNIAIAFCLLAVTVFAYFWDEVRLMLAVGACVAVASGVMARDLLAARAQQTAS